MAIGSLSLKVPVPCIRGYFGTRIYTYQTNIKTADIQNLLGHDPRSKNWTRLSDELKSIYEYLQRRTSKVRREGTASYIRHRLGPHSHSIGAFPAISIGVTKPTEFAPYENIEHAGGAVGKLLFDLSSANQRILLDGLARVTGALNLLEEGETDILANFTFPVTIYVPADGKELTLEELGQLFHDFNFLVQPVSLGQAVDLDQSDIAISLTNALGDSPVIKKHGGMERRAASLGKKSTALVAKQVLLRFVKIACEGVEYATKALRERPTDDANLTEASFAYWQHRIESFLEALAEKLGSERFRREESILFSPPGWYCIGAYIHMLHKNKIDEEGTANVVNALANIDWSKSNSDWVDLLGTAELDDSGQPILDDEGRKRLGRLFGGEKGISNLLDYVARKTGIKAR